MIWGTERGGGVEGSGAMDEAELVGLAGIESWMVDLTGENYK